MRIDPYDLAEGRAAAERVLIDLGFEGERKPDPIAVGLGMGCEMLMVARDAIGGANGLTHFERGSYVVRVADDMNEPLTLVTIAHEVGHVAERFCGVYAIDRERFAWACGLAILCRDHVMRELWDASPRVETLIAAFPDVPPTAVLLAAAEAGLAPLWIVQGARVRHQRAETAPSEAGLVVAVRGWHEGEAQAPGLRAVRLTDAPRRSALLAA